MNQMKWIAMAAFVALSGCASLVSHTSYRLQPLDNETQARLHCEKSSSGTCFFELVERGATGKFSYEVLEGNSIDIAIPEAGMELCASTARSLFILCAPQIYKRGAVQISTSTTR